MLNLASGPALRTVAVEAFQESSQGRFKLVSDADHVRGQAAGQIIGGRLLNDQQLISIFEHADGQTTGFPC
jgi:hypothetical protein